MTDRRKSRSFRASCGDSIALVVPGRVVHFSNFIDGRHYMMDKNPLRYPVTCEIDGKAHRGMYWIAGTILTVATGMGGKSTQVGSTPAEALAKRLLQDLAKEGKA